jgi:hypothetical protein
VCQNDKLQSFRTYIYNAWYRPILTVLWNCPYIAM